MHLNDSDFNTKNNITLTNNLASRWELDNDRGIVWKLEKGMKLPHTDHLEMSGKLVSLIISYGADENGQLMMSRKIVWPNLRTIPNDTHASLIKTYDDEIEPDIKCNGFPVTTEKPYLIRFDGILTINSHAGEYLDIIRTVFPSPEYGTVLERVEIKNISPVTVKITVAAENSNIVERGAYGIYMLECSCDAPCSTEIKSGEALKFVMSFSGRKLLEAPKNLNADEEENKRRLFIKSIKASLRLETPVELLNRAFDFAKLRASESIFSTKGGLMHCPGGESYYAAVWTNDQAEYAGPFFPYLGYAAANEATLNCYRLYRPFMGPDYRAIPSSIIAEGIDIWEGAGDRGDAAMYAYGAARFALALGCRQTAEELWPAIEWCLEYCKRKTNADGVIASDSDELEGRFPAGDANLSTSALAYGALRSAANLARELGRSGAATEYDSGADALCEAIEEFFGAKVEGFDTYRYYDENTVLRSWICIPLVMGIMKRKAGTIAAMFSPELWTEDGMAVQAGDRTFWDRSTLYGFRGAFAAGETDKSMKYFVDYTGRRTLGEHVPYAVEAYPEGDQRHLSAESALYCRVITEGLFNITPVGLNAFTCCPRLPAGWDHMSLHSIQAFGCEFDLIVDRTAAGSKITVAVKGKEAREYFCTAEDVVEIVL